MASTYIYRTPSSGGSGTTFTISFWMKRGRLSFGNQTPFISHKGGSDYTWLRFNSSDQLEFLGYKAGPETFDLKTTRLFRDVSAWMHICITFDSTEGTAADRIKFYVNGVKETDFATSNYPTEDNTMIINDTTAANAVGVGNSGTGYVSANNHWDGCLSHFHFIDGTAYQASTFGETDATSGIWKIKTSPSVTYGTNGFFLKMEDRTNLDLDSSSNAHTFSTTGDLTATYDNPSNNFCTLNPLNSYYQSQTLADGNNKVTTSASAYAFTTATMGLSAGLWYFETEVNQSPADRNIIIGIASSEQPIATNDELGGGTNDYGYYGYAGDIRHDNTQTSYGDTFDASDIIGTYIDLTANKLYFSKNGTIQNSGTGYDIVAVGSTLNKQYIPAMCQYHGSSTAAIFSTNFGNGYFGTDLISSPQDDAGGIGAFKYDPSTGTFDSASKDFRAICTKNIKAYGG